MMVRPVLEQNGALSITEHLIQCVPVHPQVCYGFEAAGWKFRPRENLDCL